MSSDIERRAWVTSWTFWSFRWPILMLPRYSFAGAHNNAGQASWCAVSEVSAGLADRRHVEALDPDRRHHHAVEVVTPLAGQGRDAGADLGQAAQHADRALVEPEVVDRPGDLAVLDQVDTVAGQAGEQQGLRVDLPDVPQAGQQQAALGAGDHLGQARRLRGRGLEDEVVDGGRDREAGPPGGGPGLGPGR